MANEKLISSTSLNDFFYQNLSDENKKIPCPLPEEFVFYSSLVLERYAASDVFFESQGGKVEEKILGIKLLQSQSDPKELKDIGDTVLVQLGLFADSVDKKITTRDYYFGLARSAYQRLDSLDNQFFDIPNFYKYFASSLDKTIFLLESVSKGFYEELENHFLINFEVPHKKVC